MQRLIFMRTIIILGLLVLVGCGSSSSEPSGGVAAAYDYKFPLTMTAVSGFEESGPGCAGVVTFNDFTIYSWTSATFFGSIPEAVKIVDVAGVGSITLVSTTTGHSGLKINYDYNTGYVFFGPGCSRRYRLVQ